MLLTNPFTGQVLNANPEGHNQYWNPDGLSSRPRSLKDSSGNSGIDLKSHLKWLKKLKKLETTHYEDPSTGQLKKVSIKPVGIGSLTREKLLRLAGDQYGIETDDMEPYGVDPEDTEAIREYVKKYARTYAGHVLK